MSDSVFHIIHSSAELPPGTIFKQVNKHNYIYDEFTKEFKKANVDSPCECLPLTLREFQMLKAVERKHRLNLMEKPQYEFIRDVKKGDEVCSDKDSSVGGQLGDINIDDEGFMTVPLKRSSTLKCFHWWDLRSPNSSSSRSASQSSFDQTSLSSRSSTADFKSLFPSVQQKMGTSDEIAWKSSKPFVGEKCLVKEERGRPTMCTIRKWEIGKDGKLKFILDNDSQNWVCDVETITVMRGNKQIKPNEVLETVNKYLMEQGLQKSTGPIHRDTADHNGRKLKSLNWILQEPPQTNPRFGNVRLGAVVDVLPVDGFDPVVRFGIVRWIGTCGEGMFKAVVEHVSCDASGLCKSGPGHDGGRSDGVAVNGKWLWRSSTGRCCHWVNVDLIQFHSDLPVRSADVETRQLENIPVLGTFVRFNDPAGHSVSARVLWMGLILGQECLLLQTADLVGHKQLYRQFPVDPTTFYPASVRGTGLEDFIFLPRSAVVESSSDQPAALNSMNIQQQSSVSNGVETVQPYCLMFSKTESTKHLENADLGYTVQLKGYGGKEYKGMLCWIGVNIRENRWLVGVEFSHNIRIQGRESSATGTFQGQRLWFPFQQNAVCYLLPAEMVVLSNTSDVTKKFKKRCNNALKALVGDDDNNINLIGSELILGQHVRVGPERCLACIVWTGQLDDRKYVVVKLAHPDVPWTRTRTNPYDPADVTTNTKIPGFYGDLVLIQPVAVRPLEHQLHVPRVEKENDKLLGKHVRVDIGDGRFENGIVRWTGTIDGGFLQMGIEMQIPQRPPANELVLAAVLHSLKSKWPEGTHLWILTRTMRIQEQRVVQRKLPTHIMPLGLELGRSMKVTFGDGDNLQMIFGIVMWTGLVDGQWKIAVKTMEPLPPHWVQYSKGAVELNMPPDRTLVVDPMNVSVIMEKDEAMMRRQIQQPSNPSKQPPRIEFFNGILYERQFFEQLSPVNPSEAGLQFGMNYLIQVELEGRKGVRAGICRFVGLHRTENAHFVGVELTHKTSEGGTNGTFPDVGGVKLFECPDKFGVLVAAGATRPVDLPIPVMPTSPFYSLLASLSRLARPVVKVWCGVPHCPEFFSTLRVAERRPENMDFEVGFLVEVQLHETHFPPSGECRWIGWDATGTTCFVGVELDQPVECEAVTDGEFCRRRLFQCAERRGVLLPSAKVKLHRTLAQDRDNTERRVQALDDRLKRQTWEIHDIPGELLRYNFVDSNFVQGFEGERGIQGRQNSCYMDTTLFSMFALNDSFDEMLCRSEKESKTMQLLREAIVNPLRRDWFVSQANVMAFREEFEEEGKTQGMKTQQKDPEEFMQVLFEKISKVPPFLKYKSKDKSHMLQLFFETNPVSVLSVEKMLELTFKLMNNDFWTSMPQNLIMLIPRDGQEFSGFKAVKHNLSLNVAPYLTAEARGKCNFKSDCSYPGSLSCRKCLLLLCEFHVKERNGTHLCPNCNIPLNSPFSLELYAVLCIEISHFVAFLRVPPSTREQCGQWLFFDSMSDRHGDINVPLVKRLEGNTDQWLEDFQKIQQLRDVSPYLKRLATNAYVLFYRDPRSSLYS